MTTPQYINNLMQKIQGNYWTGKDYFPIPGQVLSLVQNSSEVFGGLNPVQNIARVDEQIQAKAILKPIVEEAIASPDLVQATSLYFLQSAHSANRAYNSELYPTISALTTKIARLAGTLLFRNREEAMYIKGAKAFNSVFNIPVLSNLPALQQMGIGSVGKLVVSSNPGVTTMLDSLLQLSEFVLKLADIPRQFLRLGGFITSSIVAKLGSATGEIISKYQVARLLKDASSAPILVGGAGGVNATVNSAAWMTLLEVAPWVIAAAVIIIIALKMSEKKLTKGSDFMIFQMKDGRTGGFAHTSYDEVVSEDLYTGLLNLVLYDLREVAGSGGELRAVVLNKDEPQAIYAYDSQAGWLPTHDGEAALMEWYAIQRQFFDPIKDWKNPWLQAGL